jgi:hypothetical protein
MKFLDMLKMAQATKNKQNHRVAAGSKRAKQLMAQNSTKDLVPPSNNKSTQGK